MHIHEPVVDDADVAELLDHFGPVWALEELLGRLCPEQARFAVGQNPRCVTVVEDLRIDYVRDLLVAYYAPISSSCCITSLRRYFSAESRSQSLKLGPAQKPHRAQIVRPYRGGGGPACACASLCCGCFSWHCRYR